MKGKRLNHYLAALCAAGLVSIAGSARADSWEQALATCVPGGPFDTCVKALKAANLTVRDRPLGAQGREAGFELQAPFGGVSIRTFNGAQDRIVAIDIIAFLDKGKERGEVLSFFKSEAGGAKQDRASVAGAGQDCGADGWGVAWLGAKGDQPEVELQLDSPEATSPRDTVADRFKPEDALVKREGNGTVHICFLLPKPSVTSNGFIDAPTLSPKLFKAFLQSPYFHGKARPKGAAPAASSPAQANEARGSVILPPEAQRALFDVYYVDPKEQAAFAATCGKRAADLNGDGQPEFVVELEMQGGSDGRAYCDDVLLAAEGGGYAYVADVDCCNYKMIPAAGGKGGEIQCTDGKKKTVFAWKGSWPHADKRTTQSKVKADFDKGRELLKAGKLAEAKPLLCSYRNASGSSENPEFANGCATVLLRLKDTVGAEGVLNTAVEHHPDYNAFYANLGTLWELKGDGAKAVSYYEKYVAAAAPGAGRDAIKKRIEDLKQGGK
jgi:hypothetical protein